MLRYNRRKFMGMASAGFAGVTLGGSFSQNAFADSTYYGGFRMGAQSYCFRKFSLEETLEKMNELGLKYIELYPGHANYQMLTPSKLKALKKQLADAGITADAYGVVGINTDETMARKVFEFSKELGIRSLSADPSEDSFDMLDKLVDEYEIPISIHNHGPHHKWGKPEAIHAAVKDHHKLIGICADTGHYLRAGVDPVHALQVLKGRVFGLHVKDFVTEEQEEVAGEGKLDLSALFAELRKQNFDGACSLEYELDEHDPVPGMRKGLINATKALKKLDA